MTHEQITALVEKQRGYFSSGSTLPAAVRVDALRKLRQALSENEGRIAEALTVGIAVTLCVIAVTKKRTAAK